MRLLNVKTGQLEEFPASTVPKYAVLSHTWGIEEVTYLDLYQYQNASLLPFRLGTLTGSTPESKPSYSKIRHARRQAEQDGIEYLWADTCCIDKSSSAELSEAINSMYRWYANAAICYAYLEDAPSTFPHKQVEDVVDDLTDLTGRRFISCRWFSRGWTLQELLAPRKVTFYGGKGWRLLGTKETLADWIVLATGVDRETLLDPSQLRKISVARRMSWASNRVTTRVEDVAYCLLGIFGVNMPLLYGEGENAFIRLQEEIMKFSDDQSLFAWKATPRGSKSKAYGIFARSPKVFEDSSRIVPISSGRMTSPFLMTNRGLQIDLPMLPFESDYLDEAGDKEFLGILDCQFEDDFSTCLAITLKQTQTPRVFVRLEGEECSLRKVTPQMAAKAVSETLFIPRDYGLMIRAYMNCQVQCESLKEHGYTLVKVLRPKSQSRSRWNPETQVMRIEASDESGSQEFLPHATFVFRNRRSGTGFAVRLDLKDAEGATCTRISRLRHQSHDYAFFHQHVLASYLNASKGFAGSVALLNGTLPPRPTASSRAAFSRSSNISSKPPPTKSPSSRSGLINDTGFDLTSRSTADSESDLSMSSSMLSIEDSKSNVFTPATSRTSTSSSLTSRVSNPGSRADASGGTVIPHFNLTKLTMHDSSDEDGNHEEYLDRMKQLIATNSNVLRSYCTTFQQKFGSDPGSNAERKVVLKLPKDNMWKSWTVGESQFKKMLGQFNDDWYTILEKDAEKSVPMQYVDHLEDMEDGSQQRMSISARLNRQDIFGQKLHVLTVEMDIVRHFEMG
jgi:hypothetical protein